VSAYRRRWVAASEARVLTVVKVSVAQGGVHARYLEGRAARPAAGDYYLRDGERVEAPARWVLGPLGAGAVGVEDSDGQ
jgi:hypothetical protein